MDAQKKTLGAAERDEEARGAWRRRFGGVDPRRFVFVDESSTNVRMVPLRARAPRGERAYGKAPKNWEKNVTLISSISLEGMGASMSIEGSADGEAFLLYVEHFLCPTLEHGRIVVMDNLQVHKMKRVRELIEGRGCSLVFLPSYSPNFNPIEEAFSKTKALLRKARARSFEALVEATGAALSAVSERDALGFFAHCGYVTSQAQSL
jgi:transposase